MNYAKVIALLETGRSHVENGWTQGSLRNYRSNGGMQVCAVGGVEAAAVGGELTPGIAYFIPQSPEKDEALRLLFASLRSKSLYPDARTQIERWNDGLMLFGRLRVMRLYTRAIKQARELYFEQFKKDLLARCNEVIDGGRKERQEASALLEEGELLQDPVRSHRRQLSAQDEGAHPVISE